MAPAIVADGMRLESRWAGPPAEQAPTLVFLHEGLGSMGLWRDFPDRLAERTGLGALVYSRAGYGGSDPVPLPRPLSYMEREGEVALPELLERAGVRRAVLFGHSDGASIALVHAGSTRAHPGLLGLVLEAPHVSCEEVAVESIEAARRAYQQGELRAKLERWHGSNVDVAFRGWNDAWLDPGFRAFNLERYLPAIRVPSLLVQGEDDEYGTLAQLDVIEEKSGGPTERLVLPRCRHSPHRDQPEAVLERAAVFIAGLLVPERGA